MGISLRKYAAHRGVSLMAVQKAIRSGRITKEPDGTIDPARADVDWERNTRVSIVTPEPQRTQPPAGGVQSGGGPPDYKTSRSIRLLYEAKLAKLKIDVREGRLVDLEEVNRQTFERARRARDRLLMVPRRMAPLVAAESSAEKIREMLAAAFDDALEDWARPETTLPLPILAKQHGAAS